VTLFRVSLRFRRHLAGLGLIQFVHAATRPGRARQKVRLGALSRASQAALAIAGSASSTTIKTCPAQECTLAGGGGGRERPPSAQVEGRTPWCKWLDLRLGTGYSASVLSGALLPRRAARARDTALVPAGDPSVDRRLIQLSVTYGPLLRSEQAQKPGYRRSTRDDLTVITGIRAFCGGQPVT